MKKLPLFTLPCPSTGLIHGPTLIDEDRGLLLALVCDDGGRERQVGLLFVKPRAFRKREETYCTGWHIRDALRYCLRGKRVRLGCRIAQ